MKKSAAAALLISLVLMTIGTSAFFHFGRSLWHPVYLKYRGARTVADVIQQYGTTARKRLNPAFFSASVDYPPNRLALLGLKAERLLEIWALEQGEWHFIKEYPIRAASGMAGPKLLEGDRQVPEGLYRIIGLNPNSSYHLSMKLNYPNAFDLRNARKEGRNHPGGDIFIHGKALSIGCLAMGDVAIEDLFVMVGDVGKDNVKVVIAPHDPRKKPLPQSLPGIPWSDTLYRQIEKEFEAFQKDA